MTDSPESEAPTSLSKQEGETSTMWAIRAIGNDAWIQGHDLVCDFGTWPCGPHDSDNPYTDRNAKKEI